MDFKPVEHSRANENLLSFILARKRLRESGTTNPVEIAAPEWPAPCMREMRGLFCELALPQNTDLKMTTAWLYAIEATEQVLSKTKNDKKKPQVICL